MPEAEPGRCQMHRHPGSSASTWGWLNFGRQCGFTGASLLGSSSSTQDPFGGQTLRVRAPKREDVGSPAAILRRGRTPQGTVHRGPGMKPDLHVLHQCPAPLEVAV